MIHITFLYSSLLAFLYLILSINVIRMRYKSKISLQGLGEDKYLNRAIRIHGNFAEYVPISLILFALLDFSGTSHWILHSIGISLILARISHAWGLSLSSGRSVPRFLGTLLTFLVLILLAVLSLTQYFS